MLVTTAQEGFAAAVVGIGWINVKVFDAGAACTLPMVVMVMVMTVVHECESCEQRIQRAANIHQVSKLSRNGIATH